MTILGKTNPLKANPLLAPPVATDGDLQAIARLGEARARLKQEIAKVIIGQESIVDDLLTALFARGHCLMIGVPGLAKTLMVRTIARAIDLEFNRVQFTPDLMPSDITGTEIIEEDRATGGRQFRFVRGPVFANILLADEINRTPPKTQAALLQAMQELQVTVGGQTYELPRPFFVLATQNPIEQEGTYPLPEAQLDRFMFDIRIRYPKPEEELQIAKSTTSDVAVDVSKVLTGRRSSTCSRSCGSCRSATTSASTPWTWPARRAPTTRSPRPSPASSSAGAPAPAPCNTWCSGPRPAPPSPGSTT
jgi:MoxR-like ATPase